MKFKTLLGGIPSAIALYLIFTNLSNSPVQGKGEVCRVKDGSVHDGDTLRVICLRRKVFGTKYKSLLHKQLPTSYFRLPTSLKS